MLYTPLYYDRNNYKRKEDEINGHIWHSGWHPVMAPPVALCHSTPYPPCEQWWGVLSSSLTLVGPPFPVITHMHEPSSLQAVARSRGVWCHGHHHLPLVPVIILFCIGGAGAGGIGIGIGAGIVIVLPSLSSPFLLNIVMEMVTGLLAPIPPCEQGLAVVGGGCWAVVSSLSSLCTGCSSQAAPTIHSTSSFS